VPLSAFPRGGHRVHRRWPRADHGGTHGYRKSNFRGGSCRTHFCVGAVRGAPRANRALQLGRPPHGGEQA
jgi:hypothetical protein